MLFVKLLLIDLYHNYSVNQLGSIRRSRRSRNSNSIIMGKSLPSVISSVIAVAILAYLIYFCCLRKKRRNGQTFQAATIIGPAQAQPQGPYPYPTGISAYPTQPTQTWPSYGQPASPQQYSNFQHSTNYTGAPYPSTNHLQQSGMPMPPTNVPNSNPYGMPVAPNYSSDSPAFSPSAPPPAVYGQDDLPPPYSSVVGRP